MKNYIFIFLSLFVSSAYCAQKAEKDEAMASAKHTGKRKGEELSKKQKLKQKMDQKHINETLDELFEALILSNNTKKIDEKIEEIIHKFKIYKIETNSKLIRDEPPLYRIAFYSELNKLAKFLIDEGADINASPNGFTVLFQAIQGKNIELLKLLISKGVSVIDPYISPLSLALTQSLVENSIIKELLLNGACLRPAEAANLLSKNKYVKRLNPLKEEIIQEYRQKIDRYRVAAIDEIHKSVNQPEELDVLMIDFLLPNYPNDQIMNNIMQIRYALNELSPIHKENFEYQQFKEARAIRKAQFAAMKQANNQQAQPATTAASSSVAGLDEMLD